jgi:hypothetical protein
MRRIYRGLTIVFALWLFLWLWLSWPAMQDDAFIHLRYAANLLQHHIISYDGEHQDYGTSSLLYVFVLASLRKFFTTTALPRAVSSVFHVVLFGGLVWAFARSLRSAPRLAWEFALLLLALLVAPMAVRWLDDGMETSLTLCLVSLIAFAVSRLGHSDKMSNSSLAWLFLLGLIATLTRVEYLLLLGVASLTLFFTCFSLPGKTPVSHNLPALAGLIARCAAPLIGSLLAAGLIVYTMHALVPDTAIAKADASAPWLSELHAVISVLASSLSFGMVLMLFWVLTFIAILLYQRGISLAVLAANSLFPITVSLAVVRGQQVQGIRYFLWTLWFPILWNILELRWNASEPAPSTARGLRFATYGVAVMLIVLVPIESTLLYRLFRARSQSLAEFRAQHLERLSSMQVVAFDVGYIGYFTHAPLCDMAGLVNGRVRARLAFHQRVNLCVAEHPQIAFVSRFSLDELANSLDLKGWSICSVYDLANLRASDLHYLIASPEVTSEVCAAAGNSPRPLAPMLQRASVP